MARPSVLHPGFLIPNAAGVTSPQMAEPDQVDFNTLGNARYGVIEGCLVTVTGSTAFNTSGTALVNGQLVTMAGGQTVNMGSAGQQDRYDLLAVDTNGALVLVPGTASDDPVFPDPPTTVTVLAVVFCAAGSSNYTDNVVDKRKFLPDSLLTKISPSASLLANRNGTGNLFGIDGSGITTWANDTLLQRSAAKTLRVSDNLVIDGDLTVGDDITADALTLTGRVTSTNLRTGAVPTVPGNLGDIYQATTGRIYVYTVSGWAELATLPSVTPVGTVINSLQPPSVMIPLGWVPINGDPVTEAAFPSLFTLAALSGYITGVAPNRVLTMPNASNRVLMGDFTQAGVVGGSSAITVALANMPRHKHNTTLAPGGGYTPYATVGRNGTHSHRNSGGRHPHGVHEDPHRHQGMEGPTGLPGQVVGLFWGGQNKIDAYFNDRSHTYSVEAFDWTMPARTNLQVLADATSDHEHVILQDGDHDHSLNFDTVQEHPHVVSESDVGGDQPITYRPPFLTVFVYVRA